MNTWEAIAAGPKNGERRLEASGAPLGELEAGWELLSGALGVEGSVTERGGRHRTTIHTSAQKLPSPGESGRIIIVNLSG